MSVLKKVILLENVKNLAVRGSLVKVKRGYARNFLVPQKLAVFANAQNMAELEKNAKVLAQKNAESLAKAQEQAQALESLHITIPCKANATDGKLFGSVTVRDIVKELVKNGLEVTSKDIAVDPIKKTGDYNIKVVLHPEVTVQIPLSVVHLQDDTPL